MSHSTPPRCDDPNDFGSSGQGIVRLLTPVLKERSHVSADNGYSRGNDVRVEKSRNASVSGKFKDVIQSKQIREVEGFLEERGVFVKVLNPGGSKLLSIKIDFKDDFVLPPLIGSCQFRERVLVALRAEIESQGQSSYETVWVNNHVCVKHHVCEEVWSIVLSMGQYATSKVLQCYKKCCPINLVFIVHNAVQNGFDRVLEVDRVVSEFPFILLVFRKKLVDSHDDMLHRASLILMDRQGLQAKVDCVEWDFNIGIFECPSYPTSTLSNLSSHGSKVLEQDRPTIIPAGKIVVAVDAKLIERNWQKTGRQLRAVVKIPEVGKVRSVVLPILSGVVKEVFELEKVVYELLSVTAEFMKVLVTANERLLDQASLVLHDRQSQLVGQAAPWQGSKASWDEFLSKSTDGLFRRVVWFL